MRKSSGRCNAAAVAIGGGEADPVPKSGVIEAGMSPARAGLGRVKYGSASARVSYVAPESVRSVTNQTRQQLKDPEWAGYMAGDDCYHVLEVHGFAS